jgi:hypothetical protein
VAEGGDGAVVRRKLAHQPDGFQIADAGSFQKARGSHLVEISPDVEPQHVGWMVSGTAGGCGDGAAETQLCQVQAGDERIDDADQRITSNIVADAGGSRVICSRADPSTKLTITSAEQT